MLKSAIAFAESEDELRIQLEASRESWIASRDLAIFGGVLQAGGLEAPVRLRMADSRLRKILMRAERDGLARRVPRPAPQGGTALHDSP